MVFFPLPHRVIKPAKRTKEARNWEGGSISKKELGSLDCSDQPQPTNGDGGGSNGPTTNGDSVDVSW